MLRNRIKDLEERIADLDRGDLLDELDLIVAHLDPADPIDLDMDGNETMIELDMLENVVWQAEYLQQFNMI